MKKISIFLMITLMALAFSCKKDPEAPEGSSKVTAGATTIDEIKATSAKASSSFATGVSVIQDHGFCWGVNANPDLSGSHKSLGSASSSGAFAAEITSLTESTHYFIRSYVKSQEQVRFGPENEFPTLALSVPVVVTDSVTNITATSATCGGNVTSDGNGTVSARGVCWNTTGNPTLANSIGHTTDVTGTGSFTSNITGLNQGTTYYVTAYATNEKGTIYSTDIKQFIAEDPFLCGTAVSHGGKNYQTVQIGTQCWFKENLNIGTRINGSQDQTNNGVIEKYCYDDNEANCNTYGGLYQWDELMQYVTTQGAKGLCPDGWHIPTDAEWTTLTTYPGGESVAGGKMKSTSGWYNNGNGSNSSGFTALPGGRSYDDDNLSRDDYDKTYGRSCRCLQDQKD
jgi:uncharacterized protein (TIGR02145 family)